VMDVIRAQAENTDSLQGFQLLHCMSRVTNVDLC